MLNSQKIEFLDACNGILQLQDSNLVNTAVGAGLGMSQHLKDLGRVFLAMTIFASLIAVATGSFFAFQLRAALAQSNGGGDLCGNTITSSVEMTSTRHW